MGILIYTMSSDIQINSYRYNSSKKEEEDAYLESLKKSAIDKKIQIEKIQQKQQEQKVQEVKQTSEISEEKLGEIKLIEKISETLKIEVSKLSLDNIKQLLPQLKTQEAEIAQRIVNSHSLEEVKDSINKLKLEEKGIKLKFSDEYNSIQEIAKALKIPPEKITTQDIEKYIRAYQKTTAYIPKNIVKKENPIRTDKDNSEEKLENNQDESIRQIQDLTAVLKNKKEEIQKELRSRVGQDNSIELLNKQIGKLQQRLNEINLRLKDGDESLQQKVKELKKQILEIKQDLGKAIDSLKYDDNKVGEDSSPLELEKEIAEVKIRNESMPDKKLKYSLDEKITDIEKKYSEAKGFISKSLQDKKEIEKSLTELTSKKDNLVLGLKDTAKPQSVAKSVVIGLQENTKFTRADVDKLCTLNLKEINAEDLLKLLSAINNNTPDAIEEKLVDETVEAEDSINNLERTEQLGELVSVLKQVKNIKEIKEYLQTERDRAVLPQAPVLTNKVRERQLDEIKVKEAFEKYIIKYGDLSKEQTRVILIKDLRAMFIDNHADFQLIASLLINKGILSKDELQEEFGVYIDKGQMIEMEEVTEENLLILGKLMNMGPEQRDKDENFKKLIEKGRIDRNTFGKYYGKEINKETWDFGVMTFNLNTAGMLKGRAELKSLEYFWQRIQNMTKDGKDEQVKEAIDIFFSKQSFSELESDLMSFFIIEYEEYLIDPDYHLFDLYSKYLSGRSYRELTQIDREELTLALLIRFVQSMEKDKLNMYRKLMEYVQMPEYTKEFARSIELMEYYFGCGGTIRNEYFNMRKPLNLIKEDTFWDDSKLIAVRNSKISEFIKDYKKPAKLMPKIKLRSMSERMKGRYAKT